MTTHNPKHVIQIPIFKIKSSISVMLEHMHYRNTRAPQLRLIASVAFMHGMCVDQSEIFRLLEETLEYFHRYIFIFDRLLYLPSVYMGHQRETMADISIIPKLECQFTE